MSSRLEVKRTDDEIDEVLNVCADAEIDGGNFHGMTYEQGVEAGIRWLTKDGFGEDETPFS